MPKCHAHRNGEIENSFRLFIDVHVKCIDLNVTEGDREREWLRERERAFISFFFAKLLNDARKRMFTKYFVGSSFNRSFLQSFKMNKFCVNTDLYIHQTTYIYFIIIFLFSTKPIFFFSHLSFNLMMLSYRMRREKKKSSGEWTRKKKVWGASKIMRKKYQANKKKKKRYSSNKRGFS